MTAEHAVMALFRDEDQAVAAIGAIQDSPWPLRRVHSPIPSHKIAAALNIPKSKVGYFTLAGGITGFFAGFLLAAFTATRWNMIVSGKPIVALVPFFIVGFEFTILFAVFGNIVGLIHQMQLPGFKGLAEYDARCSGEHFGVVAACQADKLEALKAFVTSLGGEAKVLTDEPVSGD